MLSVSKPCSVFLNIRNLIRLSSVTWSLTYLSSALIYTEPGKQSIIDHYTYAYNVT